MADYALGGPFRVEIVDGERVGLVARAGTPEEIKIAFSKEEIVDLATSLLTAAANLGGPSAKRIGVH